MANRALAYSHDMEPHSEATGRAAHVVGVFGKPRRGPAGAAHCLVLNVTRGSLEAPTVQ